jgi:hypothetical protein
MIGRIEIDDLLERERDLMAEARDAQADRSRFHSAVSHDRRRAREARARS